MQSSYRVSLSCVACVPLSRIFRLQGAFLYEQTHWGFLRSLVLPGDNGLYRVFLFILRSLMHLLSGALSAFVQQTLRASDRKTRLFRRKRIRFVFRFILRPPFWQSRLQVSPSDSEMLASFSWGDIPCSDGRLSLYRAASSPTLISFLRICCSGRFSSHPHIFLRICCSGFCAKCAWPMWDAMSKGVAVNRALALAVFSSFLVHFFLPEQFAVFNLWGESFLPEQFAAFSLRE